MDKQVLDQMIEESSVLDGMVWEVEGFYDAFEKYDFRARGRIYSKLEGHMDYYKQNRKRLDDEMLDEEEKEDVKALMVQIEKKMKKQKEEEVRSAEDIMILSYVLDYLMLGDEEKDRIRGRLHSSVNLLERGFVSYVNLFEREENKSKHGIDVFRSALDSVGGTPRKRVLGDDKKVSISIHVHLMELMIKEEMENEKMTDEDKQEAEKLLKHLGWFKEFLEDPSKGLTKEQIKEIEGLGERAGLDVGVLKNQ